jgi:hypothetical protein
MNKVVSPCNEILRPKVNGSENGRHGYIPMVDGWGNPWFRAAGIMRDTDASTMRPDRQRLR